MRLTIYLLYLFFATVRNQVTDDFTESLPDKFTTKINPRNGFNITYRGCPSGSECVPFFSCKDQKIPPKILQRSEDSSKEGLIDIRLDEAECSDVLDVCCSVKEKVTESLETPEGCGFRNIDGVGFKIRSDKDQETRYGEFPWMVAILREEQAGNQIFNFYQCGGSIIRPGIVLTAAQCVDGRALKTIRVRAGEWDIETKAELLPDQERNVVEVIVHPDYYREGLFNDIALLILDASFEIGVNVKPVCLPPATADFNYFNCFATGWGKNTFEEEGKYHAILKKIDLSIVPSDTCQAELRKTRLGNHYVLHNAVICAGGGAEKDTCIGDGGSPLVCPIPGGPERYYQAGIFSWRFGCGDPIPGVYANVAKFRWWIDEQLAYKRANSTFYTS